jgi:hypothetical protein
VGDAVPLVSTRRPNAAFSWRDMPSLSCATVIARSNGFIDAEIDNEVVALSIEQGSCYGLNQVGSRIWAMLEKPVRIGDLCATLLTEYKVDTNVCERQVLDLLEELRNEGMIEVFEEK